MTDGLAHDAGPLGDPDPWPLIAYPTSPPNGFGPEPAPPSRPWMDATADGFARRCLPLTIANHAGWTISAPFGLRARWDGAAASGGIEIDVLDPTHPAKDRVIDHFGSGILTFIIPYVFRTPPGLELLVRGAPNFWIEGAHALEGVVETDWSTMTFTMNWRIISPHRWIEFDAGDPICFLQPLSLATIEAAEPTIVALDDDPEVEAAFLSWAESRDAFNADEERNPGSWQKDYHQGKGGTDESSTGHRTRVNVATFTDAGVAADRALGTQGGQ